MNQIHSLPFSFFFIDDLLPECFGQKKGMTFRSLLTDEPITSKITYEGIKQNFQNLHAEFEAFDNFYKKIQTITNRDDFLTQQIIGRNKKTHTHGNNCFELVFSQDGRMDVSIIQVDGIKCVLILDVRISRHYDKSDNVVHLKNNALANRILSALDERKIYKTKNMVEADAAFKNGLIAYQNNILQSINTNEAKFEILLNTLDSLIFSNRGIEAKKSLFFDTLFDITQELNTADQKNFESFVEQQLASDNIKQHHKVLLQKLWYVDQFNDDDKNNLTTCFNKIKVAKTFAWSFLNQTVEMLEDDAFSASAVMDMYRIFNKIPTSCLYVLQDELNDIDIGGQDVSAISAASFQKQMVLFLEQLIHLKTHTMKNIYPRFKQLCEDCYKGRIEPSSAPNQKAKKSPHSVNDVLYMSMKWLSTDENIDTIAHALMHIIIHGNPSMHSLIDNPQNEGILSKPNSLGYHWFNGSTNNETLSETIHHLVLEPHKHIETILCEKYPFLANYIVQSGQHKNIPNHKLRSIYTSFKKYTAEEEFDTIYNELKTLAPHEQNLLRTYFLFERANSSEDIDIDGYILGSLELINLENRQQQKRLSKSQKEQTLSLIDDEKAANKQMRQNFINAFNDFVADVDNEDKRQTLEHLSDNLNPAVLNGLKTLPKNDITGIFIRRYMQEKERNQFAFEIALPEVISMARQTKQSQLFDEIQSFFANLKSPKNTKKLQTICTALSQNDLSYIMDTLNQNPTIYAKEGFFINLYRQHTDKDFSSFLNIVRQEHALSLVHEQETRLIQFETTLNIALFSSDAKANNYLIEACQALSKEDIKFALSERNINIPGKILLQKIAPIAGQNMPAHSEKIKAHIDSVRQMTDFQNTFATFAGDYNNTKHQKALIEKYLKLPTSDIDIFVNINRKDPFCATFFEKLLKNKRKYADPIRQQDGAVKIIKSTVKKFRFHDAISAFLNQTKKNADKQFVDHFLMLTQDDSTELSEIISENQNHPLLLFFLKEMKNKQKEAKSGQEKQTLQEFLQDTDWMIDFYQSMKVMAETYRGAEQAYKNNPTEENLNGMETVRHFAKIQMMPLSLDKTGAALFANLFEKNSMVYGELVKHGFCQAVLKHKEQPSERLFYATIIAFCIEMNDNHYEEILQEQGQNNPIADMIHGLQKHLKCDSFSQIKRRLGLQEYIERITEFLFIYSSGAIFKNVVSSQKPAWPPYLREQTTHSIL